MSTSTSRKLRRAAEHQARKAARKAGLPCLPQSPVASAIVEPPVAPPSEELRKVFETATSESIPEPGYPFPSLKEISPARLAANRLNAQSSCGPKSIETRFISAQNHTLHGLARHDNGNFKILNCEDPAAFDSLTHALLNEHQPGTETESILVNHMAQSHWLAQRAQRLQDICLDSNTGAITDEKKFSLYMRYQTTHTRAFHKSLNDLLKLRGEKRKAELGFEAQRIASEKLEMKKHSHYWEVLKKDAIACQELSRLTTQNLAASRENPGFEAKYEAELANRGLDKNSWEAGSKAA